MSPASSKLKGKTIRKVHQSPFESTSGTKYITLDAIEFTDGTWLQFIVVEGEDNYGVECVYPAQPVTKEVR